MTEVTQISVTGTPGHIFVNRYTRIQPNVLHYAWICTCLVKEMLNSLDDCDILEKVINLTYVHKHNDALVSIKVQEFRSRYAKYVYYNCSRVVCECHG